MRDDPADLELPPGTRVGDYEVLEQIGQGGMGRVYTAVHPQIGKRVAIKVLSMQVAGDPQFLTRFLREAQVVNRIRHPGLVDIFTFGELASGRPYLVMELLSGEPLSARMARGPMPFAELLDVFTQILEALSAVHETGVVHRDLKPENIFLTESTWPRGGTQVKILDFGLAKVEDTEQALRTRTGILMGTPMYMSPEQCRGRDIDPRTDLYALGVMLYEIVTGQPPFDAPSSLEILTLHLSAQPAPPATLAVLPEKLDALILRALEKQAARRFGSAREMQAALSDVAPPGALVTLERRPAPPPAPAPAISQRPTSAPDTDAVPVPSLPSADVIEVRSEMRSAGPKAPSLPPATPVVVPPPPARRPWLFALLGAALLSAGLLAGRLVRPHGGHTVPPPPDTLPADLARPAVPPDLRPPEGPDLLQGPPDLALPTVERPAKRSGGVMVASGEPHAVVWVDGRWRGEGAVVEVGRLFPGRHSVSVYARQYHPFKQEVEIEGGRNLALKVVLMPVRGKIPQRPTGKHRGKGGRK